MASVNETGEGEGKKKGRNYAHSGPGSEHANHVLASFAKNRRSKKDTRTRRSGKMEISEPSRKPTGLS